MLGHRSAKPEWIAVNRLAGANVEGPRIKYEFNNMKRRKAQEPTQGTDTGAKEGKPWVSLHNIRDVCIAMNKVWRNWKSLY